MSFGNVPGSTILQRQLISVHCSNEERMAKTVEHEKCTKIWPRDWGLDSSRNLGAVVQIDLQSLVPRVAQDPAMREPIVPSRLEVLFTSCFKPVLASDAAALKGTDEWWRKMRTFPSWHFLYPNVYSTVVLLRSAALVKS
eukprot:Skav228285  [mRNA]  locus=scaffold1313:109742:110199:+ [translate_table: standard]